MNRSHLRWVPYAFIAALAVAGQYLAGVAHLHPANPPEQAAILGVALGIEGMAIWLAYLADRRGRVGERALPYRIISAAFAVLGVGIQTAGHWPELYLVAVFGGFSIAGYTVWCIESITALRDSWDPDGRVRSRVPAYGLLKYYEKDPKVVSRARLIAQTHAEANPDQPGIGPVSALQLARQALAVDARRAVLRKVIREQYKLAGLGGNDIEMALLAYGTEQVAAALIDRAENDGLAAALLHNIRPARLLGVTDAAWEKLAGHLGGQAARPGDRVPTSRPTRPKGKPKRVPGTGGDMAALERLDGAYQELCDELGTIPSVRVLAQRADVSRSGTDRWLRAKRNPVPAS